MCSETIRHAESTAEKPVPCLARAARAELDVQIQMLVYFKHLTAVLQDNVETVGSLLFVCV